MAEVPVTIQCMIYPRDKSGKPYPATVVGFASITGLQVGGGPILPPDPLHIDETHVGLVHERRGLQAVTGALPRHATPRNPTQLVVHKRHELVERRLIALAPCQQQPGDLDRRTYCTRFCGH